MSAHRQGAALLLPQGLHGRVRVTDVHGAAPAVCVVQPQQQRVEALVEVLRRDATAAEQRRHEAMILSLSLFENL